MQALTEESGQEIPLFYDKPHPRWEVAVSCSDGQFQQISYVNCIATTRGGTHVSYVTDQVVSKVTDMVKKKNKEFKNIKPYQIKVSIYI